MKYVIVDQKAMKVRLQNCLTKKQALVFRKFPLSWINMLFGVTPF